MADTSYSTWIPVYLRFLATNSLRDILTRWCWPPPMATDYSLLGGPDPMVSEEVEDAGLAWPRYETRPFVEMLANWSQKLQSLWIPVPARPDRPHFVAEIRTPAWPID